MQLLMRLVHLLEMVTFMWMFGLVQLPVEFDSCSRVRQIPLTCRTLSRHELSATYSVWPCYPNYDPPKQSGQKADGKSSGASLLSKPGPFL